MEVIKEATMQTEVTHKKVIWVDLARPSKKEIDELSKRFKLPDTVTSEIQRESIRARVDLYDKFIYVILHFPMYDKKTGEHINHEVDFIVGKDFFVTIHFSKFKQIRQIAEILSLEANMQGTAKKMHGGLLFFFIIKHLYASLEEELDQITTNLGVVEDNIFKGNEHSMVISLSKIGRKLIDVRRVLKPHENILNSFQSAGKSLFGEKYEYYPTALSGEFLKIWSIVEDNKETLDSLRETNDSLLSTKINDIMKFLTIMAFVTFPLTLIAGIFGMNTANLPIIGHENDFWIIIGIMVTATISFFIFFKYKRWL